MFDPDAWAAIHAHPFFSGEPGPPGTEHLWGDRDHEDMAWCDEQAGI